MELPDNNNSFGVEVQGKSFFIGHTPVNFVEGKIKIDETDIPLTHGLKQLLYKSNPQVYTEEDLNSYKLILFLTSGHKRGYDPYARINANKTIKYKKIISKLFPPKRRRNNRQRAQTKEKDTKHIISAEKRPNIHSFGLSSQNILQDIHSRNEHRDKMYPGKLTFC